MNESHKSGHYTIRLKGHLSFKGLSQFDDMTTTLTEDGETELTGQIVDQAALHGLLRTIRDMGAELISVNRVDADLMNHRKN